MITDTILAWFTTAVVALLNLVPGTTPEVKAAFNSLPAQIDSIVVYIAKLDPIIPFDQINVAVQIFFAGFALALSITVVSKLISLFTGGGGLS